MEIARFLSWDCLNMMISGKPSLCPFCLHAVSPGVEKEKNSVPEERRLVLPGPWKDMNSRPFCYLTEPGSAHVLNETWLFSCHTPSVSTGKKRWM
jgi:hypothetical protein